MHQTHQVVFLIFDGPLTAIFVTPIFGFTHIGAFQIRPGIKMAAISQNGGDKLQILPEKSALPYVLGAKHNEVTIFIN